MPRRNWGLITSGAMFESLVTTLVFFEDSGAALFGREGQDGGQDVRSSSGKLVYQAKYHQDASAAKAIADAKKEAEKIKSYRTSGHPRNPQWQGVTQWRLVTNASFNPRDQQNWNTKIVPLFQALGLSADFWEQATLDALLEKNRRVDQAYFQNQTRVFLSLPEVKEMLPGQEPFLQRETLGRFIGREAELQSIKSFLSSDKLFLVVHGPGGVGKTRFVVEAGEMIVPEGLKQKEQQWQILWANVASMEASGTWFGAIVTDRPTLVIVDEPDDERILRILAEQLGQKFSRTSRWKVVLTVRSPKDPVLKFLSGPRIQRRVEKLEIKTLLQEQAEAMCSDLLTTGPLANTQVAKDKTAANKLAKRFSKHPVWLTLAVHVLESSGDLALVPETAAELAEFYLSEVVEKQNDYPSETLKALLRSVALIGKLNRQDVTAWELIVKQAQFNDLGAAKKAVASLVRRRALIEWGAHRRFVEVKPDVLRDHLLMNWLSVDEGYGTNPVQPSGAAKDLTQSLLMAIQKGTLNAVDQAILTSLARTEFVLHYSGQSVPLLQSFMDEMLKGIDLLSASTRITLAKTFIAIAGYRPRDAVNLSRILRTKACDIEHIDGIFAPKEIGQDDVIKELAWLVFHAAFGAHSTEDKKRIIVELCALVEAEAEIVKRKTGGYHNDGKRAKDLLRRTLAGGPEFWSDFSDAVEPIAMKKIESIAVKVPSVAQVEAFTALLQPALSVERQQNWSERHTVHFQIQGILPAHPAWPVREKLKTKIKALLESGVTPLGTRLVLWPLFADSHSSLLQSQGKGPREAQNAIRKEMLDDLTWAYGVLTPRVHERDEFAAARKLWDWHFQFEKDPELRQAANDLEDLYRSDDLVAEFLWLMSRDEWEARPQRAAEKAQAIAKQGAGAIEAFLERAKIYFGENPEISIVFNVARELGNKAEDIECVQDFIKAGLGKLDFELMALFAAIAGEAWVFTKRRSEPDHAQALVEDLVSTCGNNEQKINFLLQVYGQLPRPKDQWLLPNAEFRFIRSQEKLFMDAARGPEFLRCVTWGLEFDWQGLKIIVERVLDALSDEQIVTAQRTLVKAIYWVQRDRVLENAPSGLSVWLLDQLLRVADLDSLSGDIEWHLKEILNRFGKAPLAWLPKALRRRLDMKQERGDGDFQTFSLHMRLSRFVAAIDEASEIDTDCKEAIADLLGFTSDEGIIGYYLDQILRDVDPLGRIVPAKVADLFSQTDSPETARRLARIGGAYDIGTPAWRTIATPVLERAAHVDERAQSSLFWALTDHGVQAWSGAIGEVPEVFKTAVETARQRLEAEEEANFRPFWQWRLANAEADLKEREEAAKEERGE